jgi:hypothetical protein
MSLSVTTDVFCDESGCHTWVAGTHGRAKAEAREARYAAGRMGWSRERRGDGFVDLCPEHAAREVADRG